MALWTLLLSALALVAQTAHAAPMSCAELLQMVNDGFPEQAILAAIEDMDASFSPADAMCASESGEVPTAVLGELTARIDLSATTTTSESAQGTSALDKHPSFPPGAQAATTLDGMSVVLLSDGTWHEASTPRGEAFEVGGGRVSEESPVTASFRGTRWGSPLSMIKSMEKSKLEQETADSLVYSGEVAGFECLFGFNFIEDQLVFGKYVVIESHTNKNGYIQDFDSLKKGLTLKYGPPTEDNVYWQNDLYRDDYSNWGMAVSVGHLSMYTEWTVGDTEVLLGLSGDNYDVSLGVDYYSVELRDLRKAATERESTEGL